MTLFTGNWIRHSNWGRTVLNAVLIAWLTTAFQPCLMAMEMSPEPVAAMSMADHSDPGSQGDTSTTDKCAHCPTVGAQSKAACESVIQADCDQSPDYYDARTSNVKAKDAPSDVPVGIAPTIAVISIERCPRNRSRNRRLWRLQTRWRKRRSTFLRPTD